MDFGEGDTVQSIAVGHLRNLPALTGNQASCLRASCHVAGSCKAWNSGQMPESLVKLGAICIYFI